jgi:hypothetical protein
MDLALRLKKPLRSTSVLHVPMWRRLRNHQPRHGVFRLLKAIAARAVAPGIAPQDGWFGAVCECSRSGRTSFAPLHIPDLRRRLRLRHIG